jgi:hypothetical protein
VSISRRRRFRSSAARRKACRADLLISRLARSADTGRLPCVGEGAIYRTVAPGDRVRILRGPFSGRLAVFADMKPRERVEVLLRLLGGERHVTLARCDIEAVF